LPPAAKKQCLDSPATQQYVKIGTKTIKINQLALLPPAAKKKQCLSLLCNASNTSVCKDFDQNSKNKIMNPFTASCEKTMSLSVLGVPSLCEKFPHTANNF
jgi:hypothetical protein